MTDNLISTTEIFTLDDIKSVTSSPEGKVLPPEFLYYIMGFWAFLTGTTGCLANLLAIFLFIVTPKLRTPMNYLLLNLSVCELFISVTSNWVLALNAYHRYNFYSNTGCSSFPKIYDGHAGKLIYGDRPFPLSSDISTIATMAFIWIYTFLIASPPLFGWGEFGLNTLKVSCGVVWDITKSLDSRKMTFIAYIYILGFLLPLMIIVFSYSKIISAVKNSGLNNMTENDSRRKAKLQRDRKLTKMVIIMLGGYLIIWFPYACVSIAESAGYSPYDETTWYIHAIPTILTKFQIEIIRFFGYDRTQESTQITQNTTLSSKGIMLN